jgi:tripartite-type tricarboxylate transporter receptor subunit TctC
LAGAFSSPNAVLAQQTAYPNKPIRLLSCCTGFPENVSRVLAQAMQEQLNNHSVVVETRAGANGIIAAQYVATQPPDGYTIFIGTNSTHAANQSLYKKLPYDYVKDFQPLAGVARGALQIVTRADIPANNIAELTALIRQSPGKFSYGYGSSSAQVAIELYKLIESLQITPVPYKTNPQVTLDLLGGRIDIAANVATEYTQHIKAGKLRSMGTTGSTRLKSLPDVPTLKEAGVKDYELTFWNAAYLPAGVPPALLSRVNEIFVNALKHPKVVTFLENSLTESFAQDPAELARFQVQEHDKWKMVLKAAAVEPQ